MSEEVKEKSLQDVLQAAVTAHDSGVIVNWQALCLQTYEVSMAEIKRLTALVESPIEGDIEPVDE